MGTESYTASEQYIITYLQRKKNQYAKIKTKFLQYKLILEYLLELNNSEYYERFKNHIANHLELIGQHIEQIEFYHEYISDINFFKKDIEEIINNEMPQKVNSCKDSLNKIKTILEIYYKSIIGKKDKEEKITWRCQLINEIRKALNCFEEKLKYVNIEDEKDIDKIERIVHTLEQMLYLTNLSDFKKLIMPVFDNYIASLLKYSKIFEEYIGEKDLFEVMQRTYREGSHSNDLYMYLKIIDDAFKSFLNEEVKKEWEKTGLIATSYEDIFKLEFIRGNPILYVPSTIIPTENTSYGILLANEAAHYLLTIWKEEEIWREQISAIAHKFLKTIMEILNIPIEYEDDVKENFVLPLFEELVAVIIASFLVGHKFLAEYAYSEHTIRENTWKLYLFEPIYNFLIKKKHDKDVTELEDHFKSFEEIKNELNMLIQEGEICNKGYDSLIPILNRIPYIPKQADLMIIQILNNEIIMNQLLEITWDYYQKNQEKLN